MHEYSLVRGLLSQIEELRRQHDACLVLSLRLIVGEFSGVEADLLQSAFQDLSKGTPAEAASIDIVTTELTAECHNCGNHFTVDRFQFVCPQCQSTKVSIERGDELILESVTFEHRD